MISSFLHSKQLGTPRTNFNVIIWVLFKYVKMENPRRLSIFGCVLKSEAVEGAFKTHHGPYDYQNIKQNVAEPETCE